MRILIVDDSQDGRDLSEAMLLSAGYEEIATAGSGNEAYRFLGIGDVPAQQNAPVDLVLLDILMPEIDGIEVCASIRKEPRYFDVPIVMVTALNDIGSLAHAFVAGATDYITKPMNRVELLARVRSALKLKSELDRRKAREQELLDYISLTTERHATVVDETTGLFFDHIAEAYIAGIPSSGSTSVIALAIDRLDAVRSTQGDAAASHIFTQVAGAVRTTAATIGAIAATYCKDMIVLVVPDLPSGQAIALGEALRSSVAELRIANPESISADHVTASVFVATAKPESVDDRRHLITRAISALSGVQSAGGNRVGSEHE